MSAVTQWFYLNDDVPVRAGSYDAIKGGIMVRAKWTYNKRMRHWRFSNFIAQEILNYEKISRMVFGEVTMWRGLAEKPE